MTCSNLKFSAMLKILPIMLALYPGAYYVENYAGIIGLYIARPAAGPTQLSQHTF